MMCSSILKLLFITTVVTNSMGHKCWRQPSSICKNRPCNDVYIINEGFHENQHTQMVCPKSDGHDVILCTSRFLEGECYVTQILKGQSCTNVDSEIIKRSPLSAKVFGHCSKLYGQSHCRGDGRPQYQRYNQVSASLEHWGGFKPASVGLCPQEDWVDGGCDTDAAGRRTCTETATKPPEPPKVTYAPTPPPQKTSTTKSCILSKTSVNGRRVCKNSIIFMDDFRKFDSDKWSHEIKIASKPDYEFTVYSDDPNNIFVKDEILHVKPIAYRKDFVESGEINIDRCTGDAVEEECSRNTDYNILPPVQSAQITTQQTFNFKYGVVEVQAQFPVGDWIAADIRLVPADHTYGPHYESGLVKIMSRGNLNLKDQNSEEIGSQTVEGSVMLGYRTNVKAKSAYYRRDGGWQNEFHNFTIIWTPEDIAFLVDGKGRKNTMRNAQGSQLSDVIGLSSAEHKIWSAGTSIAPFDQPFYLSIGVSVGGIRSFQDDWDYSEKSKPWSNTEPKEHTYERNLVHSGTCFWIETVNISIFLTKLAMFAGRDDVTFLGPKERMATDVGKKLGFPDQICEDISFVKVVKE